MALDLKVDSTTTTTRPTFAQATRRIPSSINPTSSPCYYCCSHHSSTWMANENAAATCCCCCCCAQWDTQRKRVEAEWRWHIICTHGERGNKCLRSSLFLWKRITGENEKLVSVGAVVTAHVCFLVDSKGEADDTGRVRENFLWNCGMTEKTTTSGHRVKFTCRLVRLDSERRAWVTMWVAAHLWANLNEE